MEGSYRLGRIAGIDVNIHVSWLLAFGLVTWSLAHSVFPANYPRWAPGTYWTLAVVAALLLFGCVLLHELSHSFVARALGLPVAGITLFVFGGVSTIQGEAEEPGDEFWMAFVGPLTSFALAALAWLLLRTLDGGRTPLAALLAYLADVNLLLGIFNLIPGFPLDGGRVLRSILWGVTGNLRQATRIAARVGQGVAYLFILGGIVLSFQGALLSGIWLVFIGWFLLNAAEASAREGATPRLRRQPVGALLRTRPVVVPADLSVAELVEQYMLGQGARAVMVADDGRLVGLVSLTDVKRVPPSQWASTPLHAVMTPAAQLVVVTPESSLQEALARLAERDVNQLPVVRDGVLVGMLSRADVIQYLQLYQDLGMDSGRGGFPRRPA
ncbi:MAG TPA: site-2 protease family protein [Chloroflexota bacterium]|nr:site-2 protease family protein [Chloroflexota bacterium]HZU07998.1 site-2 protease family protein [Chloroflexota bacterium]